MEQSMYGMSMSFTQAGRLGDEPESAKSGAAWHPEARHTVLDEAAFWSASKALFSRKAIRDDANRAEGAEASRSKLHGPVA